MKYSATAALFLAGFSFLSFPVLSAPPHPAPDSGKRVFLEGCNASLRLREDMELLEVQADSLLGVFRDDRSYFALICHTNTRRTFQPSTPGSLVTERSMKVITSGSAGDRPFHTEIFAKNDAPFPGLQSWNLRVASRDHVFQLMLYPDPTLLKRPGGQARIRERTETLRGRLETFTTLLEFEQGTEPAISETAYRDRLMWAGMALMALLCAAGVWILLFMRRRIASRAQQGKNQLQP